MNGVSTPTRSRRVFAFLAVVALAVIAVVFVNLRRSDDGQMPKPSVATRSCIGGSDPPLGQYIGRTLAEATSLAAIGSHRTRVGSLDGICETLFAYRNPEGVIFYVERGRVAWAIAA